MKFLFALLVVIAFVFAAQAIPEECLLPKDQGPCDAAFPKYFFNSETLACEEFIYGGCLGNGNRFDTLKACQVTCLFF